MTQNEIADICGVSDRTVRRIHTEMIAKPEKPKKKKKAEPKEPDSDDVIDSGDVSQEDVDLDELRQAHGLIKAFPYSGPDAANKMNLTKDDVADAEYAATWLTGLVVQARKGKGNG